MKEHKTKRNACALCICCLCVTFITVKTFTYDLNVIIRVFSKTFGVGTRIDKRTRGQEWQTTFPLEQQCSFLSVAHTGRLGNLMFQYASLTGIAKTNNRIPVVPFNFTLLNVFKLDVLRGNGTRPGMRWTKLRERTGSCAFDSIFTKIRLKFNVEILGYLQSWMYFNNAQDALRKQFRFTESIDELAIRFFERELQNISQKVSPSQNLLYIGAHIRRGDMLIEDKEKFGYTVADVQYLEKAIAFFRRLFPDKCIVFIVCSDDVLWAKRNFPAGPYSVVFSEGNSGAVDLAILSHCNHTISSTGSFSWWAGWLAGGYVTYFKEFPRKDSLLSREFSVDKSDYFLPRWVGL